MPGRGLDATVPAWAVNSSTGNVPGVNPSVPSYISPVNSVPFSSSSRSSVVPSVTASSHPSSSSSSAHHNPKSHHPSSRSGSRDNRSNVNNSKYRSHSRSRSPRNSSSSSRHQRRSRSPSNRYSHHHHQHRRRDSSRSRSRERDQPRVSVQAALAAATSGNGGLSLSSAMVPQGIPHITQMNDEEKSKLVAAALAKVGALVGTIGGPTLSSLSASSSSSSAATNDATRPFRRLYIGNIPSGLNSSDVQQFFNDTISKVYQPGTHISNVFINPDKRYAFVELFSVELSTACLALDGIVWKGNTLRVRRPSDFNSNAVIPTTGPAITLRMSNVDVISSVVVDGPNKLFIGGLNKNLTEENVRTLLQSLGKLKSFQLMKENNTNFNKGYGFAEYEDPELTEKAITVLNNTLIVDKHITVKRALEKQQPQSSLTNPSGSVATSTNMIPIGSGTMGHPSMPNYGTLPTITNPMVQASGGYPGYTAPMLNMYGQTGGYPGMPTPSLLPSTQPQQQQPYLNMYGGYTLPTSTAPSYLSTATGLIPQIPQIPQPTLSQVPPVTAPPTMRVIRLTNLSTVEDLATDEAYQDLITDVTEELSHYGKLDHPLIIPRTGTQAGVVYARYSQPNEAVTAQASLGTRTFAGRTLGITFESEAAFAAMALGYGTT